MKLDDVFTLKDYARYYIDCDAFMKWVSNCPHNEQNVETQITQMFPNVEQMEISTEDEEGNEMSVEYIQREITETKNSKNEQTITTRVTLLMGLVNIVLDYPNENDTEELSLRKQLAANTLVNMGILKPIKK